MTYNNMMRARLTSLSLIVAGVFFLLYPAIRPFSDETTIQGAEAFAATSWLLAHSFAMLGFILLALGMLGTYAILHETKTRNLSIIALIMLWIGVGLTLPFYGAETFGLHAIGRETLRQNNAELLISLSNSIRYGAGMWFSGFGLIIIMIAAILFSIAIWKSGILAKWRGIPLAVGFILFIPQFPAPQPVRIGHGLLVMTGCCLIAWDIVKLRKAG